MFSCDRKAILASSDILYNLNTPQSQRTLLNGPQKCPFPQYENRQYIINTRPAQILEVTNQGIQISVDLSKESQAPLNLIPPTAL